MRSTPVSAKSRPLRVASAMLRESAMAAIWQSAGEIGRPGRRRRAATSCIDAQPPGCRTAGCGWRTAGRKRVPRHPRGFGGAPRRAGTQYQREFPQSVTAATNSRSACWPSIQAMTSGLGAARIVSETTFVSSTNIPAAQSKSGGSRIGSRGGNSRLDAAEGFEQFGGSSCPILALAGPPAELPSAGWSALPPPWIGRWPPRAGEAAFSPRRRVCAP